MGRRIAFIALGEEILEDMLQAPKGIRIRGLYPDQMRRAIMIRIEPKPTSVWWSAIEEVPNGEPAPILEMDFFKDEKFGWSTNIRFNWEHPRPIFNWCRRMKRQLAERWMDLRHDIRDIFSKRRK